MSNIILNNFFLNTNLISVVLSETAVLLGKKEFCKVK